MTRSGRCSKRAVRSASSRRAVPEPSLLAGDIEVGVVGNLDAEIAERDSGHGTRHTSDDLLAVTNLVATLGRLDVERPKPPIHMAAVVEPRDRLLTGIATLRERDVRLVEPRLGGEDRLVELLAPGGYACLDWSAFQLGIVERRRDLRVEHLDGAGQFAGQPAGTAEQERRRVFFEPDLAPRRKLRAQQRCSHGLA